MTTSSVCYIYINMLIDGMTYTDMAGVGICEGVGRVADAHFRFGETVCQTVGICYRGPDPFS